MLNSQTKFLFLLSNMMINFQQKLKEQLDRTASISYKDICDIMDAFQIASGQGFAIGRTMALLDFIQSGKSIIIINFDHLDKDKIIDSVEQLVDIYKDIDQLFDLNREKDFLKYFS